MTSNSAFYWRVVHDCLVNLHALDTLEAQRRVRAFRMKLRDAPTDVDGELIFHEEPFVLACRLAERERVVPTPEEARAYRRILQDRARESSALGTEEEVRQLEPFVATA